MDAGIGCEAYEAVELVSGAVGAKGTPDGEGFAVAGRSIASEEDRFAAADAGFAQLQLSGRTDDRLTGQVAESARGQELGIALKDFNATGEPVWGGKPDPAGIVGGGVHGDPRDALDDESAGSLDSAGEGRSTEALDVEGAGDIVAHSDGTFEVDTAVAEDL